MGGRQAPVVWMTHFLLRIRSGCRWKHEAHKGGTGRFWKQNGERGCLQAARRHYSQRVQKFLGKEKSKHERKSHFIPLLYTILRHKFKQQRIGKSLADQQDHHWLWGTHCVLGLPPIGTRPPLAVQLCRHPFDTDQQDEDTKRSHQNPLEGAEHAATKHGDDTWQAERVGARGLSERWLRSRHASALGSQTCAQIL